MELLTVGHGELGQQEFTDLLRGAGVESLVDVRRAPGSRRHPHVGRAALERWLPEAGIAYRWEPGLGGWRHPEPASPNTALRNESFRGFADYMRSTPFWEALDDVLRNATSGSTTLMCSETLYWRCHRRLIADAAVVIRHVSVVHLGHDGRTTPHRLTEGLRRDDAGQLVYDVATPQPFPDLR
jgi:uncharacterized protein (DUF488 family)